MDILTNLPNRTAFENQMEKYRTGDADKRPIVMIVDLNGLKEINDTYGHKAGDVAIIRIAQLWTGISDSRSTHIESAGMSSVFWRKGRRMRYSGSASGIFK
ncbi:diguanylate cyclase [Blautia sp. RD014234]|nr:diguanylate cyclase [Blautia parvula]